MELYIAYRDSRGLPAVSDGRETAAARFCFDHGSGGISLRIEPKEPITLESVSVSMPFSFEETDRVFLNGYQSWTDSRETGIRARQHGLRRAPSPVVKKFMLRPYGDYDFARYTGRSGDLHGFTYGYVRRGETFRLFASLAERTGFTQLRFDTMKNSITFAKDCAGLRIDAPYDALRILLCRGTENAVFDAWFRALGIAPPRAKPITGYTSWYRFYQNISEEKILKNLDAMRDSGISFDVFQIDDGFEPAVGDWLTPDPVKFPNGLAPVAARIREAGMIPGLWLAPFACEFGSETARRHPGWLLRGEDGKFLTGGGNWGGFYVLDFYNGEVRDFLRECFRTVIRDWGFGLLKLDFLYAACLRPTAERTRGQIMFEVMDFLRECAGDALLLGCGVPLAAAFGKVDYCRIGCDAGLDFDDKPYMRLLHRERVSTKNSMGNTIFRRELSGRAFWNDPDVFFLRSTEIRLTERQRRDLARVNSLFGGVLFTSDDLSDYTAEQRALLAQTLRGRPEGPVSVSWAGKQLLVAAGGETTVL